MAVVVVVPVFCRVVARPYRRGLCRPARLALLVPDVLLVLAYPSLLSVFPRQIGCLG